MSFKLYFWHSCEKRWKMKQYLRKANLEAHEEWVWEEQQEGERQKLRQTLVWEMIRVKEYQNELSLLSCIPCRKQLYHQLAELVHVKVLSKTKITIKNVHIYFDTEGCKLNWFRVRLRLRRFSSSTQTILMWSSSYLFQSKVICFNLKIFEEALHSFAPVHDYHQRAEKNQTTSLQTAACK